MCSLWEKKLHMLNVEPVRENLKQYVEKHLHIKSAAVRDKTFTHKMCSCGGQNFYMKNMQPVWTKLAYIKHAACEVRYL